MGMQCFDLRVTQATQRPEREMIAPDLSRLFTGRSDRSRSHRDILKEKRRPTHEQRSTVSPGSFLQIQACTARERTCRLIS